MKTMLTAIVLFSAVLAFGQNQTTTVAGYTAALQQSLKDPSSLQIQQAWQIPVKKDGRVCFLSNAKNSLGGYAGASWASVFYSDKHQKFVIEDLAGVSGDPFGGDPCSKKHLEKATDVTTQAQQAVGAGK
jgi:hypothetical protein